MKIFKERCYHYLIWIWVAITSVLLCYAGYMGIWSLFEIIEELTEYYLLNEKEKSFFVFIIFAGLTLQSIKCFQIADEEL